MNALKKITIGLPSQLFEMGLTEVQVHGLAHRWFVISLFQQEKLTANEAGELLSTDRDGFLDLLNNLGVLFQDAPENGKTAPRISPELEKLAQQQKKIDTLTEELATTKYELFQITQELKQSDRVRSDFIATVSHELRTPLNSILGFAKLLLNKKIGPLNQIQQTDISIIYDSARQLHNLVNDILDLSKIDAGKIRLDMDWVSVEEIIVGVIASTYILIEDKPIALKENFEPHLPKLFADRGRIRQVVLNLLSNAAKFTETGCITLKVDQRIIDDKEVICFSVKDTGIGISKENVDKVFEPFRQVDSSDGRRAEGTGLGMPISYRLVKLHGGHLWVESKLGQGSIFSFALPIDPPESILNGNYR